MAEINQKTSRSWSDVLTTIAILSASAAIVWTTVLKSPADARPRERREVAVPTEPISIQGAATKGSPNAPVAIVEFSDFQCPFCAQFVNNTLSELVASYVDTGQVLLAFRHLPLEGLHPAALAAARISTCAQMKGQFWPVHDSFFTSPGARTEAEFIRRATRAGVSEEDLAACKDSEEALARVKADQALAGKLQLQSTPAFLIGTISGRDVKVRKIVVGARPKAEFEAVLNSVLGADKGRPKAP